MREILFRGKRLNGGEWVEGSLLKVTLDGETWYLIFGDDFIRYGTGISAMQHAAVDPKTIGQFTGPTDKNGKKVFEGDICQTKGKPLIDEKPFVVVWNDYYSGFYWENLDNPRETDMFTETVADLTEVIGNIHDNPELLEVGE